MEQTIEQKTAKLNERFAKAGFKQDRRLGMNILKHNEGETVMVKITSDIEQFLAKSGETYDYVKVDNVETGETDMTYWLSGQIKYQLRAQKDGFIGGVFAITHLGQTKVDGQNINQYDIISLAEQN